MLINLCGAFSCFCNALVYGIFNKKLRAGFVRTLHCRVYVWLVFMALCCAGERHFCLQADSKQRRYDCQYFDETTRQTGKLREDF